MEKSPNHVELEGRIGTEIALRYLQTGTAKAFCKLIVPDGERNGKKMEQWIPLTLWADRAEQFANGQHKGDKIRVTGKYTVNKWKAQDGQWREDHSVTVFWWEPADGQASGSMGNEFVPEDADAPF